METRAGVRTRTVVAAEHPHEVAVLLYDQSSPSGQVGQIADDVYLSVREQLVDTEKTCESDRATPPFRDLTGVTVAVTGRGTGFTLSATSGPEAETLKRLAVELLTNTTWSNTGVREGGRGDRQIVGELSGFPQTPLR